MPPALHHKGMACIHLWLHPVLCRGQIGQGGGQINLRQGPRRARDRAALLQNCGSKRLIVTLFDLDRMVPSIQNPRLNLAQGQGGEPYLIGRGLPMNEGFRQGRGEHLIGMGCRRLDEIAQHIVVLDLQALNAGRRNVIGLHPGNHAAPLVAQLPRLVQLCIESRGDKAPVPHQKRRLRDQRLLQKRAQHLMPHQRPRRRREERRYADDEHV